MTEMALLTKDRRKIGRWRARHPAGPLQRSRLRAYSCRRRG
jgi:hypothetical protein